MFKKLLIYMLRRYRKSLMEYPIDSFTLEMARQLDRVDLLINYLEEK